MKGRLKDRIRARQRPQLLACAVCIYAPGYDETVEDAVTVIGGIAVCIDHIGYVHDADLMRSVALLKERGNGRVGKS